MEIAARAGVQTEITRYALEDSARALQDLRAGRIKGAAVGELGKHREREEWEIREEPDAGKSLGLAA